MEFQFSHPWASKGILGILLVLSGVALFQAPLVDALNRATRIDASQHVSNLPCGPGRFIQTCPGELVCASGPGGTFSQDRVGVNVSGPYCVTPVFEQRYCGLLEPPVAFDPLTLSILPCGPDRSLMNLGPVLAQQDVDLLDRWFNTDRRSAAWIRDHGLHLLIEDPDADEIPIKGYVPCQKSEAELQQVRYDRTAQRVSFTVNNTGSILLPNMTVVISHQQASPDTLITIPRLAPGQTSTHTIQVSTTPEQIAVVLPACGNIRLVRHTIAG